VLTHSNFVELSRNSAVALKEVVQTPGASTLLFITTAHVFARFISILDVHAGVKTGHQPDTKQLLPALGSFQPTFLLAVPRVFEKVYNSAEQKAEAGGRGKIFRAARAATGSLLPQPRHRHPRGLRADRDDRPGDRQPRDQVEDRHGRTGPARCRHPPRRGRRDRGAGHRRVQGVLAQPRGDRRGVRWRLVQDR
jgi:hypothetical protein